MTKLKARREEQGMSQSQLAAAAGLNVRTLQAYEQGAKQISRAAYETVCALAAALHCQPQDIVEG